MKRFLVPFVIIALLIATLFIIWHSTRSKLSTDLMNAIDSKYSQDKVCMISLKDYTHFKWDKLVLFTVGSSNREVSKALGLKYKGSTDLMTGIIFVYRNKIVYKEEMPYHPEHPNQFSVYFENETCMAIYPDNSNFRCVRTKPDEVYHYSLYHINQ